MKTPRIVTLAVLVPAVVVSGLAAAAPLQAWDGPEADSLAQPWSEFPNSSNLYSSPAPFNLSGYDATQAIWMIRRAGLLLREYPGGTSEIIPIRATGDVRAVHVGTDHDAPGPQHEERYDIIVNGEPLDWENTFIRYGGRMVNLQALFTYRNQVPPEGLRYRLDR
jgi:hypothetical protein